MDVIVSPVLEALGITEKGAGAAEKKRNVAQSVNVDSLGKNFERYAGLDDDMTREEFEEFTKAPAAHAATAHASTTHACTSKPAAISATTVTTTKPGIHRRRI